ncbi:hypothetical protein EVAR_6750_1 [Eumeta japonica]|uniref:Uncharacterized protein n=1 Tax=Eumeta variegata TaxID=151549 RepID=A0A4C1V547_EUMVA|nr:hypothetical protein EVAR_6750_1 [Eumeta japonica]
MKHYFAFIIAFYKSKCYNLYKCTCTCFAKENALFALKIRRTSRFPALMIYLYCDRRRIARGSCAASVDRATPNPEPYYVGYNSNTISERRWAPPGLSLSDSRTHKSNNCLCRALDDEKRT